MHFKYSKFTVQKSYGFTSGAATVPSIWALDKWLAAFVFVCLQEIGCCCSGRNDPFWIRHCSKELRLSCVSIFEDHYRSNVATAIAVVWSRPHRHQFLIKHELVALVDKLMCPADQLQIIDVDKLIGHLCPKQPSCSSGADGPSVNIFRVWPHQITKCTFVGNLLVSLNGSNLI